MNPASFIQTIASRNSSLCRPCALALSQPPSTRHRVTAEDSVPPAPEPIIMADIRLIWIDTAMAGVLHQGASHFESTYKVRLENSAQMLRDVISQTLVMHKTKPPAPW